MLAWAELNCFCKDELCSSPHCWLCFSALGLHLSHCLGVSWLVFTPFTLFVVVVTVPLSNSFILVRLWTVIFYQTGTVFLSLVVTMLETLVSLSGVSWCDFFFFPMLTSCLSPYPSFLRVGFTVLKLVVTIAPVCLNYSYCLWTLSCTWPPQSERAICSVLFVFLLSELYFPWISNFFQPAFGNIRPWGSLFHCCRVLLECL